MREEVVVRVVIEELLCVGVTGALLVGLGRDDHLMQALDLPAVFHEVGGQPVEQFRVRGLGAFDTKVVRVAGDGLAKMLLPDAVDDGAGGQRVVRVRDPLGEGQATTAQFVRDHIGINLGSADLDAQRTENAGADLFTGSLKGATGEDVAFRFPRGWDFARHPQFAGVEEFRIGAVVNALHHRLVAFQTASPDPHVLLADFELALLLDAESDVADRFHLIGIVLAGFLVLVGQVVFRVPRLGGGLAFVDEFGDLRFGEVEQALDVGAAFVEAIEVFVGQEMGWALGDLGAGKGRIHAVVVARRQRIELVIVALEAAHRGGEESLADRIDDVVEVELSGFFVFHHGGIPGAHAEEAGGDEEFGLLLRVLGLLGQFVSGDLLHDELVVRLVFVEGTNDVVAVAPCVGALVVVRHAAGVGIAGDIEPVLRPALAVMRGREEAGGELVDGGLRVAGMLGLEGGDFLGSRRQADQVKGDAADQGTGIGGRSGFDLDLGEFLGDEGVDGVGACLRISIAE